MPRYRSDTPAARLRDAPARARRIRRLALGVYAGVCVAALAGVVLTTPGSPPAGHSTAALASAPADDQPAAPSTAPAGRVHISGGTTSQPLPADWPEVRSMLSEAVDSAAESGHDLSVCVHAIDASTEPMVCAGEGTRQYAASVTKVASAVAALEAWGGDTDARTPLGVTIGDLVDEAISVSDNYAADQLTLLSAAGPATADSAGIGFLAAGESSGATPFEAINAITARVGLADRFHAGNYYTEWYWSDDSSHIDAAGAARYLAELIRAADGEEAVGGPASGDDGPLTEPAIARYVLDAMLAQERRGKIPAELPAGTTANKTGETDSVSHDLAVLNTEQGRVVMSMVSTAGWLGDGPHTVVAEAAAEVVELFGGPAAF